MLYEINPRKIFDNNRRKYAQQEEYSITNYVETLKQMGFSGMKRLQRRAYALTQIGILENTMLDTRRDLAGLGIPQARKLFRRQLPDLEKTKEYALNGYVNERTKRKILWHQIKDTWEQAIDEVNEFKAYMPEEEITTA